MPQIFYSPLERALDSNGDPLPGAKLSFYKPGTSTRKDTYTDEALTTPHANPVVADADGEFAAIYLLGKYKVVLTDANDVQQWSKDNYEAITGGSDVSVDNIKALVDIAASNLAGGETAFVRAFYSDTDTGGGHFYWDADRDKSTANGGTIIDPDTVGTLSATALGTFLSQQGTGSGTGCLVKLIDVINVDDFGARADDSSDNTDPIQAAFDAAQNVRYLVTLSPGTYVVNSPVINKVAGIKGQGNLASIIKAGSSMDHVLKLGDGLNDVSGDRIDDFTVDGNSLATNSILLERAQKSLLTGVRAIGAINDGFHFDPSTNGNNNLAVLLHCEARNNGRDGVGGVKAGNNNGIGFIECKCSNNTRHGIRTIGNVNKVIGGIQVANGDHGIALGLDGENNLANVVDYPWLEVNTNGGVRIPNNGGATQHIIRLRRDAQGATGAGFGTIVETRDSGNGGVIKWTEPESDNVLSFGVRNTAVSPRRIDLSATGPSNVILRLTGTAGVEIDTPTGGAKGRETLNVNELYEAGERVGPIESGTWTPTIEGSSTAGSQSYASQDGTYERRGNTVTVFGEVFLSSLDASAAGDVIIGGFPFAAKKRIILQFGLISGVTEPANHQQWIAMTRTDKSEVMIRTIDTSGTTSDVDIQSVLGNNSRFFFTATYEI